MPPQLTLGDDVTWDGLPVVGVRVQTLLAVLVAHAPEVVSDGRLIEELSGQSSPPTRPRRSRSSCRGLVR